MNDNQLKLLAFVIEQHGAQKRKYNHEPYWFHLYRVARMAGESIYCGFEIGLCHDLIEDTDLTLPALTKKLQEIGYHKNAVDLIVTAVFHLTDEYTHEKYNSTNRKDRKVLEAQRLWAIPPNAQTVKYCDLIDNLSSIVQYDPAFAKVYLAEKAYILQGMDKGDTKLFELAKKHSLTRADIYSV